MTISTTTVKEIYEGDGATLIFAIPFTYFQVSEVKVYLRDNSVDPFTETLLTPGVEYNLTDVVDGLPTNVTMVAAPDDNSGDVGEQLVVVRELAKTQENTATAAVEESLDRAVMLIQELSEKLSRTFKLPVSSELSDIEIPEGDDQFIKWNVGGTELEVSDIDLTTLESDIASNAANIAINTSGIATNVSDIATNASDIAAVEADILTNASSIGDLQTEDAALDARITVLEGQVADLIANYGDLLSYVGIEGTETIANNQVAPLALASFVYDGDVTTSVIIEFEMRRTTDTNDYHSVGTLNLVYRNTVQWETERGLTTFDIDGVTFTIVTTAGGVGTIHYTSDNLAGTSYSGVMKFRVKTFGV